MRILNAIQYVQWIETPYSVQVEWALSSQLAEGKHGTLTVLVSMSQLHKIKRYDET